MLAEPHLAKGRLSILIGARLVKAFCRLDFSTKSALGFQKQVLSVRTTPRGLCGKECVAVRFI